MKIAVLGTGMVGETIAGRLVGLGHEVKMGSRTAANEKAVAWAKKAGAKASYGTFADAAAFGEMIFNCTSGAGAMEALKLAGEKNLGEKILIDIANPLDFSKGMPPSLFVSNTDSLGEQIQRTFPRTKVVKALNTLNCYLMVNPAMLPGDHNVFLAGNDPDAKTKVIEFLSVNFGWKPVNLLDLGSITAARATESLLPIWLCLWSKLQNPNFNFQVVVGPAPKS